LTGKYGEEADRLVFKILKRGRELEKGLESGDLADLALRYDLTVPLARVAAMNHGSLVYPFKRYQIQPVWRAERQQKGRYREFVQCDADIVGSSTISADAEIIALTYEILTALGIPKFCIHVNHRSILHDIITGVCGVTEDKFVAACVAVDKYDKIGWEGVREELDRRGLTKTMVEAVITALNFSGLPADVMAETAKQFEEFPELLSAYGEMSRLFEELQAQGVPEESLSFTHYLARGLDYYTGPIFETIVEEPKIGSITGGGRYDQLIGMFSGQDIPATGTTIGIERIFDVMRELHLFDAEIDAPVQALVAVFSKETRLESLKIAAELRRAGIKTEIYLDEAKKLGKQFAYADKKRIPFVIIAGPDEIAKGEVTIKDLKKGEQKVVGRGKICQALRAPITQS
ncbi:histidine--tRNA ligase, partial [bacterium]|nr:histidine--tRNA ligase [bacterium]